MAVKGLVLVVLIQLFGCLRAMNIPPKLGLLSSDICSKIREIRVLYLDYYSVYLSKNATTGLPDDSGLFVRNIRESVPRCCPNLTLRFILENRTDILQHSVTDIIHQLKNDSIMSFFTPVFNAYGKTKLDDFDLEFIRLYHSPGHAIIMKRPPAQEHLFIGRIFYEMWPMLLLLLALAWVVGTLGWMTDHWKNPEEFPTPFLIGVFEGYWWSIITMTTVGYGDKAPRSVPGRLLCILWVLISAVLLSLFTADASAILNASQAREDYTSTLGKKIGAFRSKRFVRTQLNLGADIIEITSQADMITLLENKTIDRVLFPHYYDFLYLQTKFQSWKNYEIAKVTELKFQIGMVLTKRNPRTHQQEFLKCLRLASAIQEMKINSEMDYGDINVSNFERPKILSAFDADRLMELTFYCLCIGICLMFFGICWDLWTRSRKHKTPKNVQDIPGVIHRRRNLSGII